MKTFTATPATITHQWFIVDAEGMVLGRLATEVAKIIRGKHKPTFTPHMDTGDNVIIINASKVRVTGKKAENHAHAVSLHFMFYNYIRPHMTLTKAANGVKTTPAMAAGLTDHVWTAEEVLELMDPKKPLQ